MSRSNAAISRLRACSSGTAWKIGSNASSGSPGKYIWVTRRVANAGPKYEKWMWFGRQALRGFGHRIGARPDRQEAVAPLLVGEHPSVAMEIRIERRVVLVGRMVVAAGGVGLPDLDHGVRHRPPVLVRDRAGDDDPFAQCRLAGRRGEVGQRRKPACGETGAGGLRDGV